MKIRVNSIIPKIDKIKFKYVSDTKFKIIIKTKIEIRIKIILKETNNNDFE